MFSLHVFVCQLCSGNDTSSVVSGHTSFSANVVWVCLSEDGDVKGMVGRLRKIKKITLDTTYIMRHHDFYFLWMVTKKYTYWMKYAFYTSYKSHITRDEAVTTGYNSRLHVVANKLANTLKKINIFFFWVWIPMRYPLLVVAIAIKTFFLYHHAIYTDIHFNLIY